MYIGLGTVVFILIIVLIIYLRTARVAPGHPTTSPQQRERTPMGIATSLLLIAAGAIMRFAVTAQAKGFSIHTVGVILMIVGIVGAILSIAFWASWVASNDGPSKRAHPLRQGPMNTVVRWPRALHFRALIAPLGGGAMSLARSLWKAVQGDPKFMRRVNGWFTIFWIVMIPISYTLVG